MSKAPQIKKIIFSIIGQSRSIKSSDDIPESATWESLYMDSLDQIEAVMAVEEQLLIELPDEIVIKWKTVGDAISYVNKMFIVH